MSPDDNGGEPVPEPDKRPTDEMRPMVIPLRMELDLSDADAVAEFLEAVARSVRSRRKIVLEVR